MGTEKRVGVTDAEAKALYPVAYRVLAGSAPGIAIELATYCGALGDNRDLAFALPVASVHVDLVRAPTQLAACIDAAGAAKKRLSLGVVDGRNVWRNDLTNSRAID